MDSVTDDKLFKYKFLAYHDALTNLPNRLYFDSYLQQLMNECKNEQQKFALLYIDLDRFKQINDSLGHKYGDQVLKEATKRLGSCKEEAHFLARVGGDEFICIVPKVGTRSEAEEIASAFIDALAKPFCLNEIECYLSASIGISFYPFDGDDADMLVTYADSAMYRAKNQGKGCYQLANVEKNAGAYETLMFEQELRKAVKQEDFLLHYQPKVDVLKQKVVGFEALIRWEHQQFGMISPQHFIPIAEETGLIIPIGTWVLKEACRQHMEWRHAYQQDFSVAVNISSNQFLEKDFVDQVFKILAEIGMPPNLLELEITESILIQHSELIIQKINQLRTHGIQISMDDFGTGFSSLNYLKKLPVDTLKIDRSFIQDLETSEHSSAIVKAITMLAQYLNINVVAEGVETIGQLEKLKEPKCNQIQGYYYSKPLIATEALRWLQTFK